MSQTKKVQTSGSITIILILVILGLGFVGYYGYNKYIASLASNKSGNSQEFISPTPPEIIPQSAWKTFSSSEAAYTFKYPEELTLTESDGYILSLWGPTQKPDTEFYDGISLRFSEPILLDNLTLTQYVAGKVNEIEDMAMSEITEPIQEVTVGKIAGLTFTETGLGTFKRIFLPSPDSTTVVEITDGTNDPTNQGYTQIVEDVLATFEFK